MAIYAEILYILSTGTSEWPLKIVNNFAIWYSDRECSNHVCFVVVLLAETLSPMLLSVAVGSLLIRFSIFNPPVYTRIVADDGVAWANFLHHSCFWHISLAIIASLILSVHLLSGFLCPVGLDPYTNVASASVGNMFNFTAKLLSRLIFVFVVICSVFQKFIESCERLRCLFNSISSIFLT